MSNQSSCSCTAQPQSFRAAYLDWAQMLSGAVLIVFMWCHLLLVSSVLLGQGVMNAIAHFFEATYMAQVGGPILFLIFVFHFVLAARKMPFRSREHEAYYAHAKRFGHLDTWLWVVQVVSAVIILVLGSAHVYTVLSNLPITAVKSAARVQNGSWLFLYLVLLPLTELHVGIGFYRIGVKWGFIKRSNRAFLKKRENWLTIGMIAIGLLTLVRFLSITVQ